MPLYAAIIDKPTFRAYGRIENTNGIMAESSIFCFLKSFLYLCSENISITISIVNNADLGVSECTIIAEAVEL